MKNPQKIAAFKSIDGALFEIESDAKAHDQLVFQKSVKAKLIVNIGKSINRTLADGAGSLYIGQDDVADYIMGNIDAIKSIIEGG